VSGGVSHLYAGDVRDKPASRFVAGNNDSSKTSAAKRLSACGIGDHDLTGAKKGIDLACGKHRLVAIGAGHDDDFM
jgi:hypothetical protein